MKKIFILLTILPLIFSCSDNDNSTENNSNVDPSNVLLKRVITRNYNTTYETVFNYNGKKLLNQKSSRQNKVFTYDGNNIVKIEWYQNPNEENTLLQYVVFEYYSNGNLKKFAKFIDAPVTVDFTYNTDNTIDFLYTDESNNYYNFSGKFKIENNEIKEYYFEEGNTNQNSLIYFNDNKNHPLKNVVGYDKLILYGYFFASSHSSGFSTNFGNKHNQVSYGLLENPSSIQMLNTFEYNTNNFPININKNNQFISDYLFYE
jgi:hypothetical protein